MIFLAAFLLGLATGTLRSFPALMCVAALVALCVACGAILAGTLSVLSLIELVAGVNGGLISVLLLALLGRDNRRPYP